LPFAAVCGDCFAEAPALAVEPRDASVWANAAEQQQQNTKATLNKQRNERERFGTNNLTFISCSTG
jgi:hypothetical protein